MTALRHIPVAVRAKGRIIVLAVLGVIAIFRTASGETDPRGVTLGFVAVGGDAGIALSAALNDLVQEHLVGLVAERVKAEDPTIFSVLVRHYNLPSWIVLNPLINGLCDQNPHVCSVSGGKSVWRLTSSDLEAAPSSACNPVDISALPNSNVVCLPDVNITIDKILLARRFKEGEGTSVPVVVTEFTRGCDSFDQPCQVRILGNNPRQTEAWAAAVAATTKSGKITGGGQAPWWSHLSGTVTLPAAAFYMALPPQSDLGLLDRLCAGLKAAESEGHSAIRKERQYLGGTKSDSTGVIKTHCEQTLADERRSRSRGGIPQSMVTRVAISEEQLKKERDLWLQEMAWDSKQFISTHNLLVGVWDGRVSQSPLEFRRSGRHKFSIQDGAPKNDDEFPDGSALAWIDPSPLKSAQDKGPCGMLAAARSPDNSEAPTDHATALAAMLVGTDGLIPDALLWMHQWDPERLRNSSPETKSQWFLTYVSEANGLLDPLKLAKIANLSCAPPLDDKGNDEGVGAQQVIGSLVRELSSQRVDALPYAVAVAAGNRELAGYSEDARADGQAQGYAALARRSPTNGFISVVGLSPDGKDVLQCGNLRTLVRRIAPEEPKADDYLTKYCGFATPTGSEDPEMERPLVVYGPAYDVGAIGVGWGPIGRDGAPALMWGSSFAAPYVTALIAEIYGRARSLSIPYNDVAANLVADRVRFTADALGSTSKFGRVNAARAYHFWEDVIEVSESDPPTAAAGVQRNCAKPIQVSDRPQDERHLAVVEPGATADSIAFSKVLRLRKVDDSAGNKSSTYEAIVREGGMLKIRKVSGDVHLPVICPTDGKYVALNLTDLDSVTPCSFKGKCRR
jgi:hypothetical protein